MKEKPLRTCEIYKDNVIYASCEFRFVNNIYVVEVIINGDDLFEDFDLTIDNDLSPDIMIQSFDDECLNRFTCFGEFTIEEIKENSGEEISLY